MPGHIRKRGRRKDGSTRWQARYTDPTASPASTRKIERTFPTRQAAERWLHQQQAAITSGHAYPPHGRQPPVLRGHDRLAGVLAEPAAPEHRPPLHRHPRQVPPARVRRHPARPDHARARPALHQQPQQPTQADRPRHRAERVRGAAERTAQAVRLGIIPSNPCTDIDLPRANRQEMLFLTAEQVSAAGRGDRPALPRPHLHRRLHRPARGRARRPPRQRRRPPPWRPPRPPRAQGRQRQTRTRPDQDARQPYRQPAQLPTHHACRSTSPRIPALPAATYSR